MSKEVIREAVEGLRALGVRFRLNTTVRQDTDIEELIQEYDAVLVATGAWKSRKLEIEGGSLGGVYCALEYLVDYSLKRHGYERRLPDLSGSTVLVVGGGLTAVDACYVAAEAGARRVILYYRRGKEQAPARDAERESFEKLIREVEFCELTQPTRFIGSNGSVKGVEAVKMALGEKDSSGRPRPIPVEGSNFTREVDCVLLAIGEIPSPPFEDGEHGIEINSKDTITSEDIVISKQLPIPTDGFLSQYVMVPRDTVLCPKGTIIPRGTIKVDKRLRTTREGVFAAGNVIAGPTQAGRAALDGMMVARYIAEYLETGKWDSEIASPALNWRQLWS